MSGSGDMAIPCDFGPPKFQTSWTTSIWRHNWKKNWGANFLPEIPPIGTPGILKFKNGEKMKHPNLYYIHQVALAGDSEETFRSSSQGATCPPVYPTRWRFHTVPFNCLNVKHGSCEYQLLRSLVWPDRESSRVYRFNSKRSIYATTDRL